MIPSISVVVPVRDRQKQLSACLCALALQKDPPLFEVIVIDDGSATPLLRSHLERSIPSRFFDLRIKRQVPLGIAAARNQGIAMAAGRLIFLIDSDSIVTESCVNRLAYSAATHPDDICFQACLRADDTTWVGKMDYLDLLAVQAACLTPDGHTKYANTAGFAIRSTYAKEIGDLFDVGVIRGSDTLALTRLVDQGYLPRYVTDAVVYHCHESSLLRFILKHHFLFGFQNGAAARIIKESHTGFDMAKTRRRDICRGFFRNAPKIKAGYRTLVLIMIAYGFKILGRTMYALFGAKPGRTDSKSPTSVDSFQKESV